MVKPSYLLSVFALAAGCADDPVSFSEPVGINLKAKSSDSVNAVVTTDKQITTESGNPYGAFVNDATAKLGKAPARIEVDHATLLLGADSKNVAKLENVFTGDVDIAFVMNDTNNTYDVGTLHAPTGVGPVGFDIAFDGTAVAAQDMPKLLGGGFGVALRGDVAPAFSTDGTAEADLQVTLTFAAF